MTGGRRKKMEWKNTNSGEKRSGGGETSGRNFLAAELSYYRIIIANLMPNPDLLSSQSEEDISLQLPNSPQRSSADIASTLVPGSIFILRTNFTASTMPPLQQLISIECLPPELVSGAPSAPIRYTAPTPASARRLSRRLCVMPFSDRVGRLVS